MQPKFFTVMSLSLYFFKKSKRPERSALGVQKASSLSNRSAYKGVRNDIFLIKRDALNVADYTGKLA